MGIRVPVDKAIEPIGKKRNNSFSTPGKSKNKRVDSNKQGKIMLNI